MYLQTYFGALLNPLFLFGNEEHSLEGLLHFWTDVMMVTEKQSRFVLKRIVQQMVVLAIARPVDVVHFTIGASIIVTATCR